MIEQWRGTNRRTAVLLFILVLIAACRFDLQAPQIIEDSTPENADEILDTGVAPAVTFDRAMDRDSAESALSITTNEGELPGDWSWKGKKAVFDAYGGYHPGIRYRLEITGTVYDARGGSHIVSRSLPFYVEAGPSETVTVLSVLPPAGSTLADPLDPITLQFSSAMAREETERAVAIYPPIDFRFEWEDDQRSLSIVPHDFGWTAPVIYTLNVDSSAATSDGRQLQSSFQGTFYAGETAEALPPPELSTILLEWPPPFPEQSSELTTLKEGESFRLEFARPVHRPSIEYAFSLSPFCAGALYWTSDSSCIFLPEPGAFFEAETEYLIKLSEEAAGEDGGRLEQPFSFSFAGSVPPPRPISIESTASGGFSVDLPHEDPLPLHPSGSLGSCTFIWRFDTAVEGEDLQVELQERSLIVPLFPPDISYPSVIHYLWIDPHSLSMQIEGIGAGAAGRSCYYSLTLPTLDENEHVTLEYTP